MLPFDPPTPARRRLLPFLLPAVLALSACGSLGPRPAAEVGYWQSPSTGIETRELRVLAREFWTAWIEWHPIEAATLGDPAAKGEWPAVSDHVRGLREEQVWEMRTKLGLLDPTHYGRAERLTYDLLKSSLDREELLLRSGLDLWMVDPTQGPHVHMLTVAREQSADTEYERDQLVERWREFALALAAFERSAVAKAQVGFVAPRGAIDRTIEQLDSLLAMGILDSPYLAPACGGGRWVDLAPGESLAMLAERELGDPLRNSELLQLNRHLTDPAERAGGTRVLLPSATDSLTPAERGEFVASVRNVLVRQVQPALESWRRTLVFDLSPAAPSPEQPGLIARPGGSAIYRDLVRIHTTLDVDPIGLSRDIETDLLALEREFFQLAAEALGTDDEAALRSRLRGDASLYFENSVAVENGLRDHLRRADAALGPWFLDAAGTPLVVDQAPPLEPMGAEPISYRPPPAGAGRPGRLLIDAGADRQARFTAAAAVFGNGLPGRHLLRCLVSAREDVALFRRYAGPVVLEAGWVDYAEALADDMGLYGSDLDRVGALSRAVLRRARAVADIRLHVGGWSRADAVEYLRGHSLLSAQEIELEIDLILSRPALALAPVVGGDALRRLRDEAREALGPAFDIARFHEVVTAEGMIGLRALDSVVDAWLRGGRPAPVEG